MTSLGDLYHALGLKPGASPEEVKCAYRTRAKAWHPDRFAHDARLQQKALEKFKEINNAYDKLRTTQCHRRKVEGDRRQEKQATYGSSGHIRQFVSRLRVPTWSVALAAFVILPLLFTQFGSTPHRAATSAKSTSKPVVSARPTTRVHLTPPTSVVRAPRQPSQPASKPTSFTLGSTKRQVLAVQGAPSSASDSVWEYSGSRVYFRNGRVTRWDIWPRSPLRVELRPSTPIDTSRGFFTVGSTKDEVLAIQGTPTSVTDRVWDYGHSRVYFRHGRVTRWDIWSRSPLKAKLPAETGLRTTRD
ncbi:MAG: DnaJ domain-containing protein [Candidatus Tectomicrobia bacterium]